MLDVRYQKLIPYPFGVVLGQYYDYEHIRFVHPETLGEYRLVERDGSSVVYEQVWPRRLGRRPRSLVRQTRLAPNELEFRFLAGRYKGVRVHTVLSEHPGGTLVDETYSMNLPGWRWLRRLVEKQVMRSVERIWKEDLDVEVCHGGWPGVAPPAGGEET
jgi:hypothetical protein